MRPELKAYLLAKGAKQVPHSGSSLWSHLSGVFRLLQAVGSETYLCEAGLFHSIYGTKLFKTVTVESENKIEIQMLIGEKAESLVSAFCLLPRPSLFEFTLKNAPKEIPKWVEKLNAPYNKEVFFSDLLNIECANLLEQNLLYKFPSLARYAQEIGMLDREGFSI